MINQRRIFSIKSVLVYLILLITYVSCNKEENQVEPVEHTGWHESMTGKILYGPSFFVIDANGTTQEAVSENVNSIDEARWSLDGSKIVFTSYNQGIMIINSDGTEDTIIVDNEECQSPVWSPDGSMIAYILNDSICILNLENNITTVFEQQLARIGSLDWAPLEAKILFTDYAEDSLNYVKILELSSGTTTELFQSNYIMSYPTWSPDGTKIAYQSPYIPGIEVCQVFIINADGTNLEQLTSFPLNTTKFGYKNISWSPDGKMIAISTYEGVFIVDMNGSIVTKIGPQSIISFVDWH